MFENAPEHRYARYCVSGMIASVKSGSVARASLCATNPPPAARRIEKPNLRRVSVPRSRLLSCLLRIILRFLLKPTHRGGPARALVQRHVVVRELRGRHPAGRPSYLLRGFTPEQIHLRKIHAGGLVEGLEIV